MTDDVWKCANCGRSEPFICDCPTDVAYTSGGRSAWKHHVARRYSLETRIRWFACVVFFRAAMWICPEPHRSSLTLYRLRRTEDDNHP